MRPSSLASLLGVGFGLGFGLAACGTDADIAPDATPTAARATWYQDVAPILSKHCMSCHQDGGIAPFALTSYDGAVEHATAMLDNVDKGVMPPFDAREQADCTPRFGWKDDQRLSAAEKATLHAWVEDDQPLGTVAEIPQPAGTGLPGITKTLKPAATWTTTGTRDQFMCFVLDPGNTSIKWMTGMQVRPGNALVVHHAVLTEVGPGAEQDALVAAHGIGLPFNCDQMATPGQFVMGIWTPGNQPMQTPADLAVPVLAGAKVVMQIHYHPAGVNTQPDSTEVDLRFSDVWPKKMYFVAAIGNEFAAPNLDRDPDDRGATPEFRIPRNSASHTERMHRQITDLGGLKNVKVYSVNPHMHLVGTHINSHLDRGARTGPLDGAPVTECLANGAWNFDWQRTYIYDTDLDSLPSLAVGDSIEVSCTWNNTIDNPFVQRMLHDSGLGATPIDITLGEQTTNEMCLEIFGLAVDAPPAPTARTQSPTITLPSFGALPRQL